MDGINSSSSVDGDGTPKNDKIHDSSNVCFGNVFDDFMTPEKT
jgi:hypothetical protein